MFKYTFILLIQDFIIYGLISILFKKNSLQIIYYAHQILKGKFNYFDVHFIINVMLSMIKISMTINDLFQMISNEKKINIDDLYKQLGNKAIINILNICYLIFFLKEMFIWGIPKHG